MQSDTVYEPVCHTEYTTQYKTEYENKIALAEPNIETALEEKAKVQQIHDNLIASSGF